MKSCLSCIGLLAIYAAIGAATAWVIQWAWNIFVGGVFHGPFITYWQAWALYILASVILGMMRSK